jgi:hypothetical protein
MLRKSAESATSTVSSVAESPSTGGRRVHNMTLSDVGSPDATPCGYRFRRSVHGAARARARTPSCAAAMPMAAAEATN